MSGNLLYIASIDFPSVRARAIQVANTCHALARRGWRVTLVVGQRDAPPLDQYLARYGLEPHPHLRLVGVPVPRVPPTAPGFLRERYSRVWNIGFLAGIFARLPGLLREARPDLLMARDLRLARLLLRAEPLHRVPLVFEAHNLPSLPLAERAAADARARREAARLYRLEWAVFHRARLVVTITERLRGLTVERYAVAPERVVCVPDAGRAPDPESTTPPQERSDWQPTIVYAGQLYPWKGVDAVLQALPGLPAARLRIVGGLEEDAQRERLLRLAAELGVADRVDFEGPVAYADVPARLASADVAVLPLADGAEAREFTSPLKLFDYLAAGLPVVAADFPTVREVLRDGENGLLFSPGDPATLASALERALSDRDLAARLRRRALETAADFTWDRRAERLEDAFGRARSNSTTPCPIAPAGAQIGPVGAQ